MIQAQPATRKRAIEIYLEARRRKEWPRPGGKGQRVTWSKEDDDRLEGLMRLRAADGFGPLALENAGKNILRELMASHEWHDE